MALMRSARVSGSPEAPLARFEASVWKMPTRAALEGDRAAGQVGEPQAGLDAADLALGGRPVRAAADHARAGVVRA